MLVTETKGSQVLRHFFSEVWKHINGLNFWKEPSNQCCAD